MDFEFNQHGTVHFVMSNSSWPWAMYFVLDSCSVQRCSHATLCEIYVLTYVINICQWTRTGHGNGACSSYLCHKVERYVVYIFATRWRDSGWQCFVMNGMFHNVFITFCLELLFSGTHYKSWTIVHGKEEDNHSPIFDTAKVPFFISFGGLPKVISGASYPRVNLGRPPTLMEKIDF